MKVCPGTINHWIYGDRKPRRRNIFEETPSPALSYIIGANKGDGCALAKSGCVKLEVTDREFAETFNSKMAELFSRDKPNRILVRRFNGERLPLYIVKYSSMKLVELLRGPLEKLLKIAFAFPREFLRGFFDAEGHVDVGIGRSLSLSVGIENSDRFLLAEMRWLLAKRLGINSRIYRKRKAGSIKVIRDEPFTMKRTSYSLIIGKLDDVKMFAKIVGFSIRRKRQKLWDALSVLAAVAPKSRPAMWGRLYCKRGGEWVRRYSESSS